LEQGGDCSRCSVLGVGRSLIPAGRASMSQYIPEQHPLRLLLREATDWAFRHGRFPEDRARDARLKGYLSEDLLVRFLHVDQLYRLRDARGRPLADVAEMLISGEAEGVSAELRTLSVQRHIGDYTLFITGIFPESLEGVRRDWRRKDSVMVQLGDLREAVAVLPGVCGVNEPDPDISGCEPGFSGARGALELREAGDAAHASNLLQP